MNRLGKYQASIIKFLHNHSFIKDTSPKTKETINELLEMSDHIPATLCLTILNNQCKKYDIRIHGYYLASGIEILMIVAKVCSNRDYFDMKYGQHIIDNMIMEVVSSFYRCITQNIESLRLSKNGNINPKLLLLCIEYANKYIPLITKRCKYTSAAKMKKTDIFCLKINDNDYEQYKKKNLLDSETIKRDMNSRYGSVCRLAMCLGWILGQNDEVVINKLKDLSDNQTISKLEKLGDNIGKLLKLHDDFLNIERDIRFGQHSLNYVVNYGIKAAYSELTETKVNFIEGSMILNVETNTTKEIIAMIVRNIDNVVKDASVDMETRYDDVSAA